MSQGKADLAYFQTGQVLPWFNKDFPFFDFMGLNNLTFLRVEEGLVEFKLPITRNHLMMRRMVHGGVLATLADIGCILVARAHKPIDYCQNIFVYTQNLRLDFLANVEEGELVVCGKVVSQLRTFTLVEVDIRDIQGNLLVRAVAQIFITSKK